ncbi:WD40-repeat-containing domain protein [Hyaloraphidium curvatum]|nr:WD40-repeat-containing domain protein [Hyaloraphidium curvatum]
MPLVPQLLLPPLPSTARGQPLRISGDDQGKSIVYCNGRSVVVRDLADTSKSWRFTGHSQTVTAARFAPSGAYIASGDAAGNLKVWDVLGTDHVVKLEQRVLSSRINDIAWDFESKRIVVAGDGKERFGHALLVDTGSSVGEISGHSKAINACALRPMRPFRAVTASDDMTVNVYNGVPYRFAKSLKDHTRFVYDVRFSPDGKFFVTTGADGKIFLYDGDSAEKVAELTAAAESHTGSIFSLCWSPDSKQLISSSADCSVKLWDVEKPAVVQTWKLGESGDAGDQQVGNWWRGDHLLSVSLRGDINFLSTASLKPTKMVVGHQRPVTALAVCAPDTFVSGSSDGRILKWSAEGTAENVQGVGHTNQVVGLAKAATQVVSAGMDDSARFIDVEKGAFTQASVPLNGIPKSLAASGDLSVVVLANKAVSIVNSAQQSSMALKFPGTAVAVKPDGSEVAIGGENNKVHIFKAGAGKPLEDTGRVFEGNRSTITALAYSPDGKLLLAGDGQRVLVVYDTETGAVKIDTWVYHNSRINSVAWSPDGKRAVSGSLDTNIILWNADNPSQKVQLKNAHVDAVNCVSFLSDSSIVSAGQDGAIQIISITQ